MSDSDSDCLSPNVGTQNQSTTVIRLKGPNIEKTINLTSNKLPRNFEKQQMYDAYNQRKAYERRDMSVMSMRSVEQPRNFYPPYHADGYSHSSMMGDRRGPGSMMGSRAGSPTMSVRTNVSNVSMTAEYIISALNNTKFNKYEMRNIREAYNKMIKSKTRRKIAKRRNLKLFLRKSGGGTSGDQGSDSSISSDDCRSTRTGVTMQGYKNRHLPSSCRISDDARSTRTDVSVLRRAIQDKTMYNDRSASMKNSHFKNIFSMAPRSAHSVTSTSTINSFSNFAMPPPRLKPAAPSIKDKYRSNFLLPCQRFNKTITPSPAFQRKIADEGLAQRRNINMNSSRMCYTKTRTTVVDTNMAIDEDDDEDELSNNVTVVDKSKTAQSSKRNRSASTSSDDSVNSLSKKTKKNSSEYSTNQKSKENNNNYNNNKDDFVFTKPQCPIKASVQNKDIIKSQTTQATKNQADVVLLPAQSNKDQSTKISDTVLSSNVTKPKDMPKQSEVTLNCTTTSEVSMRPSFLRRKLFTQTLDVTESKNLSNESLSSSPQTNYTDVLKEKHKTRKHVISGSYLNRDVFGDDNTVIDLIHKIVPPEQMNLTNTTQKQKPDHNLRATASEPNLQKQSDNDINLATIMHDEGDNRSETFTDEELFTVTSAKKKNTKTNKSMECSVVIEKLFTQPVKDIKHDAINKPGKKQENGRKHLQLTANTSKQEKTKNAKTDQRDCFSYADAFWNCDTETEETDHSRHETMRQNIKHISKLLPSAQTNSDKKNETVNRVIQKVQDVENNRKHADNPQTVNERASTSSAKQASKENSKKIQHNKLTLEKNKEDITSNAYKKNQYPEEIDKTMHGRKMRNDNLPLERTEANNLMTTKISPIKVSKKNNIVLDASLETPKAVKKLGRPKKIDSTLSKTLTHGVQKSPKDTPKAVKKLGRPKKSTSLNKSTHSYKLRNSSTSSAKTVKKRGRPRKTDSPMINCLVSKSKDQTITNSKSTKVNETKTKHKEDSKDKTTKTTLDNKLRQKICEKITVDSSIDSPFNSMLIGRVMTRRSKEILQRTLAERTISESDGSLSVTRRGRPKGTTKDKAKPNNMTSIVSNKENAAPSKRELRRLNTTRCMCDSPEKNAQPLPKPQQTLKASNTNITQNQKITSNTSSVKNDQYARSKTLSSNIRSVRKAEESKVREWGLGLAKATIGVIPRHCGAEPFNNTTLNDDAATSTTMRSSTSIMTRARRSKFLHVF